MSKNRSKIVKELDPQEVEGFSQARIEHYLRLGYKPYLDNDSEIKWLTEANRNMRDAKTRKTTISGLFASRTTYKKSRRSLRKGGVFAFLRGYWLFIALLLIIMALLAVVLMNPHIII